MLSKIIIQVLCVWLIMTLVSACVAPRVEKKRYFWPPLAERPKIEYINFYQSDYDVQRGAESALAEAILGRKPPQKIFERPQAVAADGKGRVMVSDLTFKKVFVLDFRSHKVRSLKSPQKKEGLFVQPSGLAIAEDGRTYVADSGKKEIVVFDADELEEKRFGEGYLTRPLGIVFADRTGLLYVADAGSHQVVIFSKRGEFLRRLGRRGVAEGEFNFPLDVDLDREGNLYVLDSLNGRVQVFSPDGNYLRSFGELGTAKGSFQIAKSLAVSDQGHVYVTDSKAHRLVIFDNMGNYLLTIGGMSPSKKGKIAPGGFYLPQGVDAAGDGSIWVVDSLNQMIHRFQFLTDAYLGEHPIAPGQRYLPPALKPAGDQKGL